MEDSTRQEAEYASFVDKGTQIVLQEAIQKVVENFSQTDSMEDILGYLEEMRENIQNTEERVKEVQQREKQLVDKMGGAETSVRNLLQRIQTIEVQLADTSRKLDGVKDEIVRLTIFFEKTPLARMFSRLRSKEELEETELEPDIPQIAVKPKYGKPLPMTPKMERSEKAEPEKAEPEKAEPEKAEPDIKETSGVSPEGKRPDDFPFVDEGEATTSEGEDKKTGEE